MHASLDICILSFGLEEKSVNHGCFNGTHHFYLLFLPRIPLLFTTRIQLLPRFNPPPFISSTALSSLFCFPASFSIFLRHTPARSSFCFPTDAPHIKPLRTQQPPLSFLPILRSSAALTKPETRTIFCTSTIGRRRRNQTF